MIARTAYVSAKTRHIDREELGQLLQTSRRNNIRSDVTGILLDSSQFFFQILEGPAEAVKNIYERIAADPRHDNLLCLAFLPQVPNRLFSSWSMAHYDCTAPTEAEDSESFLPDSHKVHLQNFLEQIREQGPCETLRYLEEFVQCHWSGTDPAGPPSQLRRYLIQCA